MSTQLNYATALTTKETPSAGVAAIDSNQFISQSQFNTSKNLTNTTTPPVTADAKFVATLASNTATIDLTNLTALGGAVLNSSGLRVRAAKFKAPSTNANPITVAEGASNGYTGFGVNFSCTLPPGGEVVFFDGGAGGVVNSTNKTITLTGSGNTDTIQTEIIIGT